MSIMSPTPPFSVENAVQEAVGLQRAGQISAAEQLYRRALSLSPDHPEANHNIGIILIQSGQLSAALDHFKIALQNDPSRELYWLSYCRALLMAGQPAEASAILQQGSTHGLSGPALDDLLAKAQAAAPLAPPSETPANHLDRGDALAEAGRLDEAVSAYRQALEMDPDLADAHYHLGSVLSETGHIAEGFSHLMKRAQLLKGANDAAVGPGAPIHKTKHDREQSAYLAQQGLAMPGTGPVFHIGDASRLAGPAVNPDNATPELMARWRDSAPQVIVIDNFLTPVALEKLRAYCSASTVWRRVYEAGYIGATPADGFAAPLLAQIAEEIKAVYAGILASHDFHYLGAFKYDSALSKGTNTHADVSAVNVNFYIAPDEANLDPQTGGMVVWDVEAASEVEMRRFNSDEKALQAHLERVGAKATRIAHRANRAVIFKSSLFHKTDDCRFAEGYLNKRINVSLLYGQWGAATGFNPSFGDRL